MKLTNPIGRNVSLNADNDINPRACLKNKNCTKRMFYFPFS